MAGNSKGTQQPISCSKDVKPGPDLIDRSRFLLYWGANLVAYVMIGYFFSPTSPPGIQFCSVQYAHLNFIYCKYSSKVEFFSCSRMKNINGSLVDCRAVGAVLISD